MKPDGVVCERGTALIGGHYPAERHESELHKRLEAVADAENEAVTLAYKLHDAVRRPAAPHKGGYELCGTLRFIAAGEAAGYEQNLGLRQPVGEGVYRILYALCAEVVDYKYLGLRSGKTHCPCGVKFAVGAGEHRYQHMGRSMPSVGLDIDILAFIAERRNGRIVVGLVAINAFKLGVIERSELRKHNAFAPKRDSRLLGGKAERSHAVGAGNILGQLQNEAAVAAPEQSVRLNTIQEAEAYSVADRHLEDTLGNSACGQRPCGYRLAAPYKLMHKLKALSERFAVGQSVGGFIRFNENDRVTCRLEFGRDDVLRFVLCNREGNEGRGDVQLLKAAAHGVLAANGRKAQAHLGVERTEQRRQRLAPAFFVAAELFKVFLEGEIAVFKTRTACDELCDGADHRTVCALIGVGL